MKTDFLFNMKDTIPIRIDSLNEINIKLVEKNKIQFLVMICRGVLDNSTIDIIKQAKIIYPFITVILINDTFDKKACTYLYKSGIDYALRFDGDYPNLVKQISDIFAQISRIRQIEMPCLTIGDLLIDPNTRTVKRGIKRIILRKKEYELLEFLARNQGKIIERLTILETVWGYKTDTFSNTVDVHVASLRAKIDGSCQYKLIHTIHGRGYKLDLRK